MTLLLLFALLSAENNIYTAQIVRHIDGDSVIVHIPIWPDFLGTIRIRLRDIDTPEPEKKAKCQKERELAAKASALTKELIPIGAIVDIMKLKPDKFGRRFDAAIITPDGKSLALLLVDAGLARPYDGGKRQGWC